MVRGWQQVLKASSFRVDSTDWTRIVWTFLSLVLRYGVTLKNKTLKVNPEDPDPADKDRKDFMCLLRNLIAWQSCIEYAIFITNRDAMQKIWREAWEGASLGQFVGESVDESFRNNSTHDFVSSLHLAWSKEMPQGPLHDAFRSHTKETHRGAPRPARDKRQRSSQQK